MVVVTTAPPKLAGGQLELFYTTDPLLYNSPLLVFYGQATAAASNTSRIQVHIYTPAGFESYTRLSVSPNSPFYDAVTALPREEQGDEVCRGIAYALSKYFQEVPPKTRECWTSQISANKRPASPLGLFSPTHVAVLASRLTRVENATEVAEALQKALGQQSISWLDVDIVLPPGSVRPLSNDDLEALNDEEICKRRYGRYGPIVAALGEPSFLPTSKMKRAASKPTKVGRTKTFRPGQRELIRKEMCELVDTEASYVQKLTDLSEQIATSLRSAAAGPQETPDSDASAVLEKLFPASLTEILKHHRDLLTSLQDILDQSEETAIAEIQQDIDVDSQSSNSSPSSDGIGLTPFAKALVDHLPRTQTAYHDYMEAHASFAPIIKSVLKSSNPNLVHAAQDVGEQRLTSLLIEPIQRLPRYTLYIDTISKQLPMLHPALITLLRARDAVTTICLAEDGQVKNLDVESRLGHLVENWPPADEDPARLITTLDVTELPATMMADDTGLRQALLLLFADRIVVVIKKDPKAPSARILQTDVEKPHSSAATNAVQNMDGKHLEYVESFDLKDTIISQTLDSKAIVIFNPDTHDAIPPSTFQLEGFYAGKAGKVVEEVIKARLEGRFSEQEREQANWEVRSSVGYSRDMNLFAAVFERGQSARFSGQVRIEIDLKESTGAVSPRSGSSAKIRITPGGNTFCHLAVDSNYGSIPREKTSLEELQLLISRRITPILQAHLSIQESPFIGQLVARNKEILESLAMITAAEPSVDVPLPHKSPIKASRPISPVKQLSTFLTHRTSSTHSHLPKKMDSGFTAIPNLPPKQTSVPKPASRENHRPVSRDALTLIDSAKPDKPIELDKDTSSKKLEDTLNTYLLAIQARTGNVVGRVVTARANADQVQVNDLYNGLQEDPNLMVLAAQAPVDVLFASFEKFLNVAWRDAVGAVLEKASLQRLQHEAEARFPVDFESFFHRCFQAMSPQNQRALRSIVKLLSELLAGAGNDGDRGIFTATFVEFLVPGEDPMPYVSIMDRFVEDIGPLFSEETKSRGLGSGYTVSQGHPRATNTGSLSSNPSSFRKKFGFGSVSKEPGKIENESKVGSVWRSLSKNKSGAEAAASRLTVQRTQSDDAGGRPPSSGRPLSQEKPMVLGPFSFEKRPVSQDSSLLPSTPLSTIGEATPGTGPARRKRRSSLSDISLLQTPRSTPAKAAVTPRLESIVSNQKLETPTRIATPTRAHQRSRLPSSFRKENSPGAALGTLPVPGPRVSSKQIDQITVTSYSPTKTTTATAIARPISRPNSSSTKAGSVTPSRIGLSERPSGNAMKIKPSPSADKTISEIPALPPPTKKLSVKSPQKLRERLQSEQRELVKTSATLQEELGKIGDEIADMAGNVPARKSSVRLNSATIPRVAPTAIDLAKKLNEISQSVSSTLTDLIERNKNLADETLQALNQSESRTKKLDELYREANAENEALYKRFNDELGKVMSFVRMGEGVEELKRRVEEQDEEMEGLRRERARLKREIVGLRARLGD